MRIKAIEEQYRRDFTAIYECEHCGYEFRGVGYDDDHFHLNVIPCMECIRCGKIAPSTYRALRTKYASDEVV